MFEQHCIANVLTPEGSEPCKNKVSRGNHHCHAHRRSANRECSHVWYIRKNVGRWPRGKAVVYGKPFLSEQDALDHLRLYSRWHWRPHPKHGKYRSISIENINVKNLRGFTYV